MNAVQTDVGRQSRVIVVVVIITLIALGYVLLTYLTDTSKKQSQISAVESAGKGKETTESEHYSQVLDRYNRNEASSAEQTGDSYLSVMSSRSHEVKSQPQPQPQPQIQPQVVYYQQQVSQSPQNNQRREDEITEQTQGLIKSWAAVKHGVARVSSDAVDYAKSINQFSDIRQGQQTASVALMQKVVSDFALVPATLQTDIDTDENSMVTAYIPAGEYAGAKVFAMGYKRLTNTVDMTFTYMLWLGKSYKITAKALDQVSMRTALSGEVNNRWFSRIILPAIAMGIGRTGKLYEQASSQNIITPQGGVIQTYPPAPSASAVTGTILGGIAQQGGQVLANEAANWPTKQVLIAKGETIGIQFIGPVLASDDVASVATNPAQQTVDLNALGAISAPPRQNAQQVQQGSNENVSGYPSRLNGGYQSK